MTQLLAEVTSSELVEWQAFGRIEPFGGVADDYRAGIGAAMTYNANRGRDTEPVRPLELFPWSEPEVEAPKPAETPEEVARQIRALFGRTD